MSSKTFLIQSEGLGRGDDQLGAMLMANFLRVLGENNDKPARLVFWNAGVKLACERSHVLVHLKKLEGTKVLLEWIPEPRRRAAVEKPLLFQQKKTYVLAGKITFADKSVGDLNRIMERAGSEFHAYPSFYGFAIHYYRSYQELFAKGQ